MSYGLPAESAPPAPHCYRHPDRPTWITCSRCGRPICPDCMTAAPVGYHCPECVRDAAATVRAPRTLFGGRLGRQDAATTGIIGTCVVAYALVGFADLFGGLARLGMYPAAIALDHEYGRLIWSIFLHGGSIHLALNMYFLFLLGPPIESLLGHRRFLVLFGLAGLGGSVASYCLSPINTLSVGASGAIFGLMAAWIVIGRRLNRDVSQVVGLFALNVVLGFVLTGVDWRAHLGGAVTGAVVAVILTSARGASGPRAARSQAAACVVVLLVLVAATVWRTDQITELVLG